MMKTKKKSATILDVARAAGVSASTVSRVLTGTVGVAPDKKAAIQAAIDELGYRPNTVARGLVNGSSMVIGVLTQHIASPFYGEILTGVEYALSDSNYSPMIIPGNWHLNEQMRALDVFLERRVDSLILLGGDIPDDRLHELAEELPFIMVGRTIPGLEEYCIHVDNFQGAYEATQHLISLGHTQIAHVSGIPNHPDTITRQEGYSKAIVEAGLQLDPRLIVQGDFREQSGIMAVEILLTRGVSFSGIFVGNDQMAQGVQLTLYRRGIRIPEEVSIVGYDDQPGSAFNRPPLTTVRQPAFEMGLAAAQAVLALLNGEEIVLPQLTTELIVRESTLSVHPQRVRGMVGNYPPRSAMR